MAELENTEQHGTAMDSSLGFIWCLHMQYVALASLHAAELRDGQRPGLSRRFTSAFC